LVNDRRIGSPFVTHDVPTYYSSVKQIMAYPLIKCLDRNDTEKLTSSSPFIKI